MLRAYAHLLDEADATFASVDPIPLATGEPVVTVTPVCTAGGDGCVAATGGSGLSRRISL